MGRVQKARNLKYYTPSSETFRINGSFTVCLAKMRKPVLVRCLFVQCKVAFSFEKERTKVTIEVTCATLYNARQTACILSTDLNLD
jgi:hypothetical protein